jgi:preprotein translocase subunit SecD
MLRFPVWKSVTVLVVMLVGALLALPNVFGESPALQLSRRDRAEFTPQSIPEFEGALTTAGLPFEQVRVDDDGRLWIRFSDVDQQLAARDLIARIYEGQFAVATTFASRAPDWLGALGLEPMSLGLDLRGGIYLSTRWTSRARWTSCCRSWSATCARPCATSAWPTWRSRRAAGR